MKIFNKKPTTYYLPLRLRYNREPFDRRHGLRRSQIGSGSSISTNSHSIIYNLNSTHYPKGFTLLRQRLRRIKVASPAPARTVIQTGGFTLVEMLIIAPIVILVIGVFVSAIVNMTGEVLSVRGANALTYNVQNALNTIDADVKASGGYLATNNITLSTGQGYDGGTSIFQNASVANGTR